MQAGRVGAERRVTVTGTVREQFFVGRKKVYRQKSKIFFAYCERHPQRLMSRYEFLLFALHP